MAGRPLGFGAFTRNSYEVLCEAIISYGGFDMLAASNTVVDLKLMVYVQYKFY